jgi:hypothetical protein
VQAVLESCMVITVPIQANRLHPGMRVAVGDRTFLVVAMSRLGTLTALELVDSTSERIDAFGGQTADGEVLVLDSHDVITPVD